MNAERCKYLTNLANAMEFRKVENFRLTETTYGLHVVHERGTATITSDISAHRLALIYDALKP